MYSKLTSTLPKVNKPSYPRNHPFSVEASGYDLYLSIDGSCLCIRVCNKDLIFHSSNSFFANFIYVCGLQNIIKIDPIHPRKPTTTLEDENPLLIDINRATIFKKFVNKFWDFWKEGALDAKSHLGSWCIVVHVCCWM
ncbi:hypothetical protein GQ457_15G006760 [Hibiscus cannabinus]